MLSSCNLVALAVATVVRKDSTVRNLANAVFHFLPFGGELARGRRTKAANFVTVFGILSVC